MEEDIAETRRSGALRSASNFQALDRMLPNWYDYP